MEEKQAIKVGDIVDVVDNSGCMMLVEGIFEESSGLKDNNPWKVITVNQVFPTGKRSLSLGLGSNDIMLAGVKDNSIIACTKSKYVEKLWMDTVLKRIEEIKEKRKEAAKAQVLKNKKESLTKWRDIRDEIRQIKEKVTQACGYCYNAGRKDGNYAWDCEKCVLFPKYCNMGIGDTTFERVVVGLNKARLEAMYMLEAIREDIENK